MKFPVGLLVLSNLCSSLVLAAPRTPWTSNRIAGSPNPPAPYALERLHPGQKFDGPVDLAFAPGTDRLMIAEERGKLWSFDTRSNTARAELALDWRQRHKPLDNILGFTFHPGFATNHFVFVNYNEPANRTNGAVVSRFTVATNGSWQIDPATEKPVIRWPSGGHNGCTLAFGNDGCLYISAGDADDPDPPDGKRKTGQDLSDLLASVLRLDVDHADGTNAYVVPRDNPFVALAGARPEIWAFGFRNPFRMSFDRPTGDLWLADVGWEQWEMVYRVQRGGNYGWSLAEGPNHRVRTDVTPGPGPILPPLHSVPHSDGASITGGLVYRGARLPALRGAYIYGDWETGRFWALRHDGDRLVSNEELCDTALKPISFAADRDGELVILDYTGGLHRLVPNQAPPANQSFPRRLSETGLFSSVRPRTPAPGTVAYRPIAPMWNDYAEAEWLLGVPGDAPIVTEGGVGNITGGTWLFPTNTVLARTLTLELESGQASSRRPIETQLLHWDGQGWNPYSFRWRADGADAELVPAEGAHEMFTVVDPAAPGGRRETRWRFHSRSECLRCHNAWAGDAITLNWLQLGRATTRRADGASATPAAAPKTELDRLAALGVVRVKNLQRASPLVDPHDAMAPLEVRARSWLHANCASCHRFGAGGAVAMHLSFDKPLKDLRVLDVPPSRGEFGIPGARLLSRQEPEASTLLYRISTEGLGHMPQIGSRLVDERGMELIREWLASLGPAEGLLSKGANGRQPMTNTLIAMRSLYRALPLTNPVSRHVFADAAADNPNVFIRELFQRFLPPERRRQTLGSEFSPQSVLTLSGDASRGRALFLRDAQCHRCHVRGGQGRELGPKLDGLAGKFTRAQLIDELRQPSRSVAPEFKTTIVLLRDGTEVSGFVRQRTADLLVLRDESLQEHRLRTADVKESRVSELSAMPEGLLDALTAQEAADLLEFLLPKQ